MTEPYGPDPRFPDRPDHPDLRRLAEVVNTQDATVDSGKHTVDEAMADVIDLDSLLYIAKGRLARIVHTFAKTSIGSRVLLGVWIDAFSAGVHFERAGGHREKP